MLSITLYDLCKTLSPKEGRGWAYSRGGPNVEEGRGWAYSRGGPNIEAIQLESEKTDNFKQELNCQYEHFVISINLYTLIKKNFNSM